VDHRVHDGSERHVNISVSTIDFAGFERAASARCWRIGPLLQHRRGAGRLVELLATEPT
jgi:hypothetical protein